MGASLKISALRAEIEQIETFIPINTLKTVYTPSMSNTIKFHSDFQGKYLGEHKIEFIKLWASMMLNYPLSFIKGYLGVTDGYWNLSRVEAGVYTGVSTSNYEIENIPYPSTDLFQKMFGYPLYDKLFVEGALLLFSSLFPLWPGLLDCCSLPA